MGLFGRSKNDRPSRDEAVDLSTILLQGEDMLQQLAQAHGQWGLGTADRWGLDQTTGLITWTFGDKTATAPAQILASYNPGAQSWRWAWANESVLPALARDAAALRDWGKANDQVAFTTPELDADAERANTLTAISIRVTQATGFYRGQGASQPIITFGPVTVVTDDGETSTFAISVGD